MQKPMYNTLLECKWGNLSKKLRHTTIIYLFLDGTVHSGYWVILFFLSLFCQGWHHTCSLGCFGRRHGDHKRAVADVWICSHSTFSSFCSIDEVSVCCNLSFFSGFILRNQTILWRIHHSKICNEIVNKDSVKMMSLFFFYLDLCEFKEKP